MQGNYFLIKPDATGEQLQKMHEFASLKVDQFRNADQTCYVQVERYESPRSLKANRLYWMWLEQISKHLTAKGHSTNKRDLHDLMRHKFLGWSKARMVGKTEIGATLKSTRDLKPKEFCYFMEQVEHWAHDVGCIVKTPFESEYQQFLEKQKK